MKFGRESTADETDFSLPTEDPVNEEILARFPRTHAPRVWLAGPLWADPGFVGVIYPEGARSADFLAHYCRQFNAIELNSTYYGVVRERCAAWAETARRSARGPFLFSPKLPRESTDLYASRIHRDVALRAVDDLRVFGPNLGPVLLVLPPSYSPTGLRSLADLLESFPDDVEIAIEWRHAGWFEESSARTDALALFYEHGVVRAISDVNSRRDALDLRLTNSKCMLRFAGNGLHPTDFDRLDVWVEQLARWLELGLREAYLFLHQPKPAQIVPLAQHLIRKLNERCGLKLEPPRFEQMSLFGD